MVTIKRFKKLIPVMITVSLALSGCTDSNPGNNTQKNTADPSSTSASTYNTVKVNEKIHIDQVGYRPEDEKIVIISGKGGMFEVVDEKSGKSAFKGETSGQTVNDAASGETVYYGDFTSLKQEGSFYIVVPDYGKSYSFKIEKNVYKDVKNSMLKTFYFQRCGIELEEKYADVWKHAACHTQEGYIYGAEDKKLDGKGGWHDAGDYGKYSVPAAVTLADLMMAYELFPDSFKEKINIPESGNSVPDILNESRYELEWLLKMQDKVSGGIYHKLASKGFPDFMTPPDLDISDCYFLTVSSTATADFAAVMAMASRVYKPFDESFSKKCLDAAEKAWEWLSKNPKYLPFKNPQDMTTGEYGDDNDKDERYWAAAELYRVTGKSQYHDYVKSVYKNVNTTIAAFGWNKVADFGNVSYLFTDKQKVDNDIYNEIMSRFLGGADEILKIQGNEGYRVLISSKEYVWGSNMVIANKAMQLLIANVLKPDHRYPEAALESVHYWLGRNPLDQSYVTGFGSKKVKTPHHRFALNKEKGPIPGFIVGGPDSKLEDAYASANLKGLSPAKCYGDDATSFSTNEVTIYWNSAAVFVTSAF